MSGLRILGGGEEPAVDATNDPFRAYSGRSTHLINFSFPDAQQTLMYAINGSSETAGYFIDPDGYFAPFISRRGNLYYGNTNDYPYTYPDGYNDTGMIAGDTEIRP